MLILSLVLITTGCTKDEQNTVQTSTVEKSEPEAPPLQVGMMSAVDAAPPFYHALEAGYYEEEGGVDVDWCSLPTASIVRQHCRHSRLMVQ